MLVFFSCPAIPAIGCNLSVGLMQLMKLVLRLLLMLSHIRVVIAKSVSIGNLWMQNAKTWWIHTWSIIFFVYLYNEIYHARSSELCYRCNTGCRYKSWNDSFWWYEGIMKASRGVQHKGKRKAAFFEAQFSLLVSPSFAVSQVVVQTMY